MYKLTLTEQDLQTIAFVGNRYCWSDALGALEEGENELSEAEVWEIRDAFERDTEGGHSPFPMLDTDSELYAKLLHFWDSIL